MEDWRSQAAGGMEVAIQLWEACCVPSLLHGAATWLEVSKQTIKRLNSIQQWFLRLMLQVGPGTPLAALTWDTGLLDMEIRIWIEKLLLVLHLRSLDDDTLAGKIYNEQVKHKWPGLAMEAEEICREFNIEDVNKTALNNKEYKKIINKAAKIKNEEIIKEQAKGKDKCNRIKEETYGKKEYISDKNISEVREWFKTRYKMQPFAANFSKNKHFAQTEWLCKCTLFRESEEHLRDGTCQTYGEIRKKYGNLENDADLVLFFKEILTRRQEMEDQEMQEMQEMQKSSAARPLVHASSLEKEQASLGL